ncbi:ABC transporter substrate-binding protein [Pseudomonas baltica]|uniref:substrate-binding periplasmic protein n=1 Tax=Pseudomonas baltica TaxID=2762576 RepID=UPI00289E452B|nr:ABC transporter substrate-binding protein [Pseudomonas baltica]
MRKAWCILIGMLWASTALADTRPIRFLVSDAWSMPLMEIEDGIPDDGILFQIMTSLAAQIGAPAEFHVLPRLRLQAAMESGQVDIRCYTSQSWGPNLSGDYIWSLPLITQKDYLIGSAEHALPVDPGQLSVQKIGTVLGYSYPNLQPYFDSNKLIRDDGRNQVQVLMKLKAGRYEYAVSNQMALNWFNSSQPADQQLHPLRLLSAQGLGCYVRNDPDVPVQRILRTLLRMKMSGEIDRIIERYSGSASADQR